MVTNTVFAKTDDLFTFEGHICLFKQFAGFCVFYRVYPLCNAAKYKVVNWEVDDGE